MSMHILGFQSTYAVPYAVKMGVALQLTNILRDVGEDWQMGRLYLPQDELEAFGIGEPDIENGRLTPAWRRYMRFAIERNRQLYEQAWPGLELLSPQGRRSVGAAAELYRGILDAIESLDYDVFRHRAHLNRWEKIRRLSRVLTPASLWRSTQDKTGQPAIENMSRRAEDRGLLGDRVPRSSSNA
jgi:phytoene synthase